MSDQTEPETDISSVDTLNITADLYQESTPEDRTQLLQGLLSVATDNDKLLRSLPESTMLTAIAETLPLEKKTDMKSLLASLLTLSLRESLTTVPFAGTEYVLCTLTSLALSAPTPVKVQAIRTLTSLISNPSIPPSSVILVLHTYWFSTLKFLHNSLEVLSHPPEEVSAIKRFLVALRNRYDWKKFISPDRNPNIPLLHTLLSSAPS